VEVKGLGGAAVPEKEKWDMEYAQMRCPVTRLEIVSDDAQAHKMVDMIRERAHTGHSGEGMGFVSGIDYAIRTRTDKRRGRARDWSGELKNFLL